MPAEYLPEPWIVKVVGIAGDELDLSKNRGADIVPYTLWGEMALQIGGEQVASFLMALIGYARKNTGIALVVTLAGATDAFARQTERLGRAVNAISQADISADQAVAVAEQAGRAISRDTTLVTPVHAAPVPLSPFL